MEAILQTEQELKKKRANFGRHNLQCKGKTVQEEPQSSQISHSFESASVQQKRLGLRWRMGRNKVFCPYLAEDARKLNR